MSTIQRENTKEYGKTYHIGRNGQPLKFLPEHGQLAQVTNLFDKPLEKYRENIFDAIQYIEDEKGEEFSRDGLSHIYAYVEELFDTHVKELPATELPSFIDNSLVNDDYIAIVSNYIP